MNNTNRVLIGLLILGFIAVTTGAFMKINGIEFSSSVLLIGLISEAIGGLGLLFYNSSKLKTLLK